MKKILIPSPNCAALVDAELRAPAAGEVQVKMLYSAVSAGTERAILIGLVSESAASRGGTFTFPTMAGGYSGSAEVVTLGEGVDDLRIGDRVMIHGGGHCEYATVARSELIPLPEGVSPKTASFTIISGFSLAAVRKANISLGESCMVVGLGLLGLHSVIWAKQSGALPVIAVDFSEERRELALKLGADAALDPSDPDYREQVLALTGQRGADTVIEVTGNGAALNQALRCTARFGRVVLLGCTRLDTSINFYFDVHCPGIQLIGAHSGARPRLESHDGAWTEMDDCQVILNYLRAGRVCFDDLISEVHSPEEAPEVYHRLAYDNNFPIGVVFDWSLLGGTK